MAKKKTTTRKKSTKQTGTKPRKQKSSGASGPDVWIIHVVSDATGNLAGNMIRPILTQFPGVRFEKVIHPFQDTLEKVAATLERVPSGNTLVLHALVDPNAKLIVRNACVPKQIPHYDLTGAFVQFLSDHVGVLPANELACIHQADAEYFARIEAMEYTALHDDGAGLDTLKDADIVIVGLSRVSKTPTATFLASKGYKVANVSIAPETGFPTELKSVKKKVVAFTLQPKELQRIRADRLPEVEGIKYHNLRDVIQEVMFAEQEFQKRGFPQIDTTGRTIEHVAAMVIELVTSKTTPR